MRSGKMRSRLLLLLAAAPSPSPLFGLIVPLVVSARGVDAFFVPPPPSFRAPPPSFSSASSTTPRSATTTTLNMGFLDGLREAFANDEELSSDKSEGQLESPYDDDAGGTFFEPKRTEVQKRWLESQTRPRTSSRSPAGGGLGISGAPVDPTRLERTTWDLSLYLAGIPSRDPSSDLYGSPVNVSNRDKSKPLGSDVPDEPTVTVRLRLLADGVCRSDPSPFTSGNVDGEWRVSDDGRYLRMSFDALGYDRTVQTKGTINKVFWSNEDDTVTKTTSTYSIPPGFVYADVEVKYGTKPGEIVMAYNRGAGEEMGVLRVEKREGLLGASSRMIECGRFVGKRVTEATTTGKGKE